MPAASSFYPTHLRCEYLIDPLGIDAAVPRLDWLLAPTSPASRGLSQTGYRVLVSSSLAELAQNHGDLWDSGKVESGRTNQISYDGATLRSAESVWWKVEVWDQYGKPSSWSTPATWTMGLLSPAAWAGAQWIGAEAVTSASGIAFPAGGNRPQSDSSLLRRDFAVKPRLTRALAYVCGLGQYTMTANGEAIGHDVLTPGWTLYNKTCLYDTYDITRTLHAGENAIGLFLGNGFYNIHPGRYIKITGSFGPQRAIAVIRLEYADGSVQNVVTDENWKVGPGPITFSSEYGGEDYDARLLQSGWNMPRFDDNAWQPPVVTSGPGGILKGLSAAGSPVRIFEALSPVSSKQLDPATTVYDFGQNASIMLRIRVQGPAGSSVQIIPSELVSENGDINDTMCGGDSYWTYTLAGTGDESYASKFFYRGARYLKVVLSPAPGTTALPQLESIEGDVVHADAPVVGQFTCSSGLYNSVYTLVRWAQMNNMMSIMTDCPTREKLGWLEEDHLNGPALRYNFDLSSLMSKMASDMADSQRDNGLIPSTCPDYPHWADTDRFADPPEWGSAIIAVPWQQYEYCGDLSDLRRHYGTMKRYVDYLSARASNNIVSFGLGDWYSSAYTPIGLTATAFYYYDTSTLSQMAALLGYTDDEAHYRQQASEILASFTQSFYNASSKSYATGSQASNAFPLAMGMVAPEDSPAVLSNLVADLSQRGMTAGEVSLKYLIQALAEGGQSPLLDSVFSSETSGYGLQVKQGKTSLTEGWNGGTSQDHFMFGQINEWFFKYLAGIQNDPSSVGFQKIVIRPAILPTLTYVKASYLSIQGKIVSGWSRDGSHVDMNIVIPVGATATIYVPTADASKIEESGRPAAMSPGVRFLQLYNGTAEYAVGSGTYHFTTTAAL